MQQTYCHPTTTSVQKTYSLRGGPPGGRAKPSAKESDDQLFLAFTNATPEPEASSSPSATPPLLNTPVEILSMITVHLPAGDLFSLLLTATAFPFWLLPTALPLRLAEGGTLLHHVALNASPNQMRHILYHEECRALLDTPDDNGSTPLHLAVSRDQHINKVVLEASANIDVPGENDSTQLHLAARRDQRMCEVLLEAGANVDIPDGNGSTALHLAARRDQRMCEVLLEAGANIDARNAARETPIFCAVGEGLAEVVRMLRARGANLQATEKNNLTAEQKAVMYGLEDVILALKCEEEVSRECGKYQALGVATAEGFMKIVNEMIRGGKNPFEKGGSKALSVIACWRSGGRIFEGLGEDMQEVGVAPELLVRKKRCRWEDLEEDNDTSLFEKRLKTLNF